MDLPAFQQLNPIITYLDRYTYNIGNPKLLPTFYNNISLNLLLWNSLNFYVERSFVKNKIFEVPVQDIKNGDNVKFIPMNVKNNYQFNIGLNFTKKIDIHRFDLASSFTLQRKKIDLPNMYDSGKSKLAFYISSNYSCQIKNNFLTYVKFNYYGKSEDLITTDDPSFNLSFGFNMSFLKKKLIFSLAFNDVFNSNNANERVRYFHIENYQKNNIDSRNVTFIVKYIINNLKSRLKESNINDILDRL